MCIAVVFTIHVMHTMLCVLYISLHDLQKFPLIFVHNHMVA